MPEVLLDGAVLSPGTEFRSWGELLNVIEAGHLADGRSVWTVRFDEHEVESFRSPTVLATPLGSVHSVVVESIEGAAETRELLLSAPAHVDQMTRVLSDSILLYRNNLPRQGAERLGSVLVGFDLLLSLVRSVVTEHHIDFDKVMAGDGGLDSELTELATVIQDLVRQQESQDSAGIARTLEQQLTPHLACWGQAVHRLVSMIGIHPEPAGDATHAGPA